MRFVVSFAKAQNACGMLNCAHWNQRHDRDKLSQDSYAHTITLVACRSHITYTCVTTMLSSFRRLRPTTCEQKRRMKRRRKKINRSSRTHIIFYFSRQMNAHTQTLHLHRRSAWGALRRIVIYFFSVDHLLTISHNSSGSSLVRCVRSFVCSFIRKCTNEGDGKILFVR